MSDGAKAKLRAILLVDHGSRRAEANAQLEALAIEVRALRPDHLVRTAHLEVVEPGVAVAIDACVADGAREIVIHPFFLAAGRHTREDLPRLVADAESRHAHVEIVLSRELGLHPKLVEVVMERIDEPPIDVTVVPGPRDEEPDGG